MVKQVNHLELKTLIQEYYKRKCALFIWGRFGIGKSAVMGETAKGIGEENKRKFVCWNKLTETEKKEVVDYCEKYFVFIDVRLSEYSPDDIKGLPVFNDDKKSIDFKVPLWALLMEKKDSDGILFFDEINLAVPLVVSSCYKIIYDRVVNNSKINDNWGIFGAGNISEDRAYTHDIAPPLRDRGGECELVGSKIDSWVDWALKNGINSRIIAFLSFKSSYLWKVDFDDGQKFTTYRGWARLNEMIKDIALNDYDKLLLISSTAIGEGVASEFVAFCKISEQIDLDSIIKNPSKLKEIKDIGIKYFIVSGVADKYRDDKVKIDGIMDISTELDKLGDVEFVALLWRICKAYKDTFKQEFLKKIDVKFAEKYARYIV